MQRPLQQDQAPKHRSAWCWMRSLGDAALDFVLPRRCAGCDGPVAIGRAFCEACSPSVLPYLQGCVCCADPNYVARSSGTLHRLAAESGENCELGICPDCRTHRRDFTRIHAAMLYGGALADAVRRLKYRRATHLVSPLARLMLATVPALPRPNLVVPVPLHRSRLIERGYNQAALLARPVARALGVPLVCGLLVRRRATKCQAGLSRRERQRNVMGAFSTRDSRARGQRILLVDDVVTTGCTVSACAAALVQTGALQIDVLTLARAVP